MVPRVTMSDIAKKAGISKAAVSFALNDPGKLSAETVRRVLKVAEELGYSRNPLAYMLRTQRSNSLGLLFPQQLGRALENPYYSQFIQGVGQTCETEGMTLLLVPPLRGSMLKTIPYAAVDGFIVSGLEKDRGEVEALIRQQKPFVLVDSEYHADASSIDVDEASAFYELTNHLLSLGHKKFAVLVIESGKSGGYKTWRGPIKRRFDGIARALQEGGIEKLEPGKHIFEIPCTRQGGAKAFEQFWGLLEKPTAVIAFSDIIAFGVLDAARKAGVSVPQDLSVTGFDDLAEASWCVPSLTTIRQPIATKGRLAAEYLVETLKAKTLPSLKHHQLHTSLLLRDSTAKPSFHE